MTATLTLQFSKAPDEIEFPALVLAGSAESGDTIAMSTAAETVDHLLDGALSRAAEESQFKAKAGASLVVRSAAGTAVLIGSGETITAGKEAETLGGHVFAALGKAGVKSATIYVDADAEVIADIAHGAHLASYVFKHYFTKGDQAEVKSLQLTIASAEAKAAEAAYESRAQLAEGVFLARDLVTEPANKLYPESYA